MLKLLQLSSRGKKEIKKKSIPTEKVLPSRQIFYDYIL